MPQTKSIQIPILLILTTLRNTEWAYNIHQHNNKIPPNSNVYSVVVVYIYLEVTMHWPSTWIYCVCVVYYTVNQEPTPIDIPYQ